MKTRLAHLIAIILLAFLQVSCDRNLEKTDLTKSAIIPKPVSVEATGDSFRLGKRTSIVVPADAPAIKAIAVYLAEHLRPSTGYPLPVIEDNTPSSRGCILLQVDSMIPGLNREGYQIDISRKTVSMKAARPAGLFHGVQTLLQILPAKVVMATRQEGPWELPTGNIRDLPAYDYRGAMLDVARHFFKPADVRRFIDYLALYKFNYLHLHLSDDQGWRIEIKSRPQLTAIGGSTQVGGGPGGFYTQEEYRGLVDYAASNYITIVPEIDMPGHTNAALASYAELNCDGKATPLYTGTDVGFSTLCTSKKYTYDFLADVFRELAGMTPGPYIHIGGDESHVTKKEDYIPFINQVQEMVAATGKQTVGWDDISAATLRLGTVCEHWATVNNALHAVEQGSRLILSPARKAYLDMKYDSTTTLGLHWAGYVEVDSAYNWDPATFIPGLGKESILGIEASLWSETVTNLKEVEYMTFPRLPGFGEIGWTPAPLRSWDEYRNRLAKQGKRLEAMGINFYRSPRVDWQP
jgi:hexosaminidase